MKIGNRKSKQIWRAYSRSNRLEDIEKTEFGVMLFDEAE